MQGFCFAVIDRLVGKGYNEENGSKGEIELRKRMAVFFLAWFLFNVLFSVPAVKAEDVLTLNEAVEAAKKNSKALQKMELDIERTEEVRKSAAEKVMYIPSGPTDPIAAAAWTGLVMTDVSLMMAKKSKAVEEDKIYMEVLKKYTEVLKAEKAYDYALKAKKNSDFNYRVSMLSYDAGVISFNQLKMVNGGNRISDKTLASAKVELDKAYGELNQLLGWAPDKRYKLVWEEDFTALQVDDPDLEIVRIMDGNPAVWLAEQKINLARLNLDLYSWSDPNREPYRAKEIDVEKAEIEARIVKQQMRDGLFSLYQSLQQLEEGYNLALESLKTAEMEYKNTETLYNAGMSTMVELKNAELKVEKARVELEKIALQHYVLKYAFYHPWAYSQGM